MRTMADVNPCETPPPTPAALPWRALLRRSDFTAYLVARAASDFGDKLAKVAVSVAALISTGSVLAAAAVFAVCSLPGVFADALLSPLADRRPRRTVMVLADLARTGVALAMAGALTLGAPLWVALAGVFVVEVIAAPFYAAGAGLLAHLLPLPEDMAAGNGLRWMVQLAAMSGGWIAGGILVAAGGAPLALVVDAGTFLLSAALLTAYVPSPPPARTGGSASSGWTQFTSDLRAAADAVHDSPALRGAFGSSWASTGLLVIPGGLALALAVAAGSSVQAGAWLLGAEAAGMAAGVAVVGRWPHAKQQRWGPWMAAGCAAAFLLSAQLTSWPVIAGAWALAGACTAFTLPLANTVLLCAPHASRGAVNGLHSAGAAVLQAGGFLLAGAVADHAGVQPAVMMLAATGLVAATWWAHTARLTPA